MWQQAGFVQNCTAHLGEVGNRIRMPELREFFARDAVTQLRLVAEREQRFCTTGCRARACYRQHLVTCEVAALAMSRRFGKRAIGAHVAAEAGQRNENLAGIADQRSVRFVAQGARLGA